MNYYNEIDPYAAKWLVNLINAGHIAPGLVDTRSIEDVCPSDLRGFTQCHFFAGVGVWSHALRLAGWDDHREVWTGSCPCQPFSSAGEGAGFADQRHLWPHFQWLIEECRPAVVLGEQVASRDAEPWLDLVRDDVEGMGYAFGAVAFPSAGIGAPHIRDRTYWVADAQHGGREGWQSARRRSGSALSSSASVGMAHSHDRSEHPLLRSRQDDPVEDLRSGAACGSLGHVAARNGGQPGGVREPSQRPAGPTNGLWRAADWLLCRDGRWRPVEPGTFPLAHGAPARVGRLRAYGNAINAEAARVFIEAVM